MATTAVSNNRKTYFTNFLQNYSIVLILVLLIVVLGVVSDKFLRISNLLNMLRAVSILGILSIGLTFVIIGGFLDLSIGSIMSLCMINVILLQPYGVVLAIVTTIAIGLFAGLINGFLVGTVGTNSLITTLATLTLFQAAALIYSGGYNQLGSPTSGFNAIGSGSVIGIPVPVIILVVVAAIGQFALSRTSFGRKLFLTGSNRKAAYVLGIRTRRMVLLTFVISGFCSALAAIVLSARLTSAQPTAGAPYLFDVFTAVILGGTSLYGGRGSVYNTLIGMLLLGVVTNGMEVMSLPFTYQQMVKGIILVLAVIYDSYNRRKRFES